MTDLLIPSLILAGFLVLVLAIPRVRVEPLPDIEVTEPQRHRIEIPFRAGMPRDSRGRFTKAGR